jgi:hypothetical protein
MFVSPDRSFDLPCVQESTDLGFQYFSDAVTVLIWTEELMMRHNHRALSIVRDHARDPRRLRILQSVVIPSRIEAKNLPVVVEQPEEALRPCRANLASASSVPK